MLQELREIAPVCEGAKPSLGMLRVAFATPSPSAPAVRGAAANGSLEGVN